MNNTRDMQQAPPGAGGGKNGSRPPHLSLVIPIKDERENIRPLYEEIVSALQEYDFEVIYVDDGSTDGSFQELADLHRRDRRVRVIKLKAASGKSAAYSAGFQAARGGVIATMDGDMQDVPSDLPLLLARLEEECDLVIGWKQLGKSSRSTHLLSILFNRMIRIVTGTALHDLNCPMRAMRRNVAEKMRLYGSLHRYIPLMAASQGFRIAEVRVSNRVRPYGRTKYSAGKYFKGFFDFITVYFLTRFAERPLHLFGLFGIIAFVIGLLLNLYLSVRLVISGITPQEDLPTLLLGILLILVGVQLLSIGLLGEMIIRSSVLAGRDSFYSVESDLHHESEE
jgi:glycosyltransferase involved in cell wall biosynthesis